MIDTYIYVHVLNVSNYVMLFCPDAVNILLIGSADLRHIFKTVTCSNKQLKRKLHVSSYFLLLFCNHYDLQENMLS